MKILIIRIFLSGLFLLLTSCGSSESQSATDMLRQMNIDQVTYSSMPICLKIKVYTYVGMHFFDMDHFIAIMPSWVEDDLVKQSPDDVASCISQEGFSRLDILSENPATRDEISLAIFTLISEANRLDITKKTDIQQLLNMSVCKSNLNESIRLVNIYYLSRFVHFPSYISQYSSDEVTKKMKAELCNS